MTTAPNEAVILLIEVVIVIIQIAHRYHSLAMILINLGINTETLDARDVCIVAFSYVFTHELHHLILYGITFCTLCNELHIRAMFAKFFVMFLVCRATSMLIACNKTMNHRVRVTSDRRSEVCIIIKSKSEVPNVMRCILRFHHGSECNGLYNLLFTFALYLIHKLIQCTGSGSLRTRRLEFISEFSRKLT